MASKIDLVDFLATHRSMDQGGADVARSHRASAPTTTICACIWGAFVGSTRASSKDAIDAYDEVARRAGMEPKGLIAREQDCGHFTLGATGAMDDAGKLIGPGVGHESA